jgi:hypothetical protein
MEIDKTRAGHRAMSDRSADLRFLLGAGEGNRTPTISLGMSEQVGRYQLTRRSAALAVCP